MTIYAKNRKQQKNAVRTWIGCDQCDLFGDYTIGTVDEADAFLVVMDRLHQCIDRPVSVA